MCNSYNRGSVAKHEHEQKIRTQNKTRYRKNEWETFLQDRIASRDPLILSPRGHIRPFKIINASIINAV